MGEGLGVAWGERTNPWKKRLAPSVPEDLRFGQLRGITHGTFLSSTLSPGKALLPRLSSVAASLCRHSGIPEMARLGGYPLTEGSEKTFQQWLLEQPKLTALTNGAGGDPRGDDSTTPCHREGRSCFHRPGSCWSRALESRAHR